MQNHLFASMLRNYLSIALRTIRKHKLYSFINVVGLSVGLASFFLIGLFVRHEQSFDDFQEKGDRIFRVLQQQPHNMYLGSDHFAVTPSVLPAAMMEEMPSVELATQMDNLEVLLTVNDVGYYESGIRATETFFDLFSFSLISGDRSTLLTSPQDLVLSESLARKIFGRIDVVGEAIEMTSWGDPVLLTVTAVMEDVPTNSHFQFDFVASLSTDNSWLNSQGWGNNSYYTYGLAKPGTSQEQLDREVKAMADGHQQQTTWIQENPDRIATFYTQQLKDVHLRSRVNFDPAVQGDIRYIWLFSAVAFLILLTACINYMNLATARAAVRGKEVGIRKVSGAGQSQLIRQFIGESVVTAGIATVLSLGLVVLVLPALNAIVERQIELSEILQPGPLALILLTGLAVGFLSGSYPALFLSRMQPATILKGSGTGNRRSTLRNILVVGQFAIGIVMVLGVVVIQQQMTFISNFDTGVERDHIVSIRVRDQDIRSNPQTVLEQMEALSGVLEVSSASSLPIRVTSNSMVKDWEGSNEGDEFHLWNGDINFGYEQMVGFQFVAGGGYSVDQQVDAEEGIILNQAAVKALGWTDEGAVGRELDFRGRSRILGVVQDYHFQTMHEIIAPLAIMYNPSRSSYLLAKIDAVNVSQSLSQLESVWSSVADKYPFDYEFLDDAFSQQYQTELRLSSILRMFTFLALFVAGLGLFGLAAFTAQQRTREIGIRKVLGASVPSIVLMMSQEFGRLVIVSFLIGAPLSFLFMKQWLDAFAYKTEIGIFTFVVVGVMALLLALTAVGFQAIRASMADPVRSLRSE